MQSVAAISTELVTITAGDGDPEMVIGGYVSSSMFSVLKTPPLLGRTLIAEDDGATPTPVFVLGYGLWQRRFGGDPNVIGQILDVGLELDEVGSSGKALPFPRQRPSSGLNFRSTGHAPGGADTGFT
jgi:hypothetical protein